MAKDKEVAVRKSGDAVPSGGQRDFDRLFEDFFNRRWMRPFAADWPAFQRRMEDRLPRVDVVDREAELLVRAELPGVGKDDLDVSVSDNALTIRGESRQEKASEEGDYHRREISTRTISRTIPLPCEVDGDRATARLRDGLLEVTLPKVERAKRKRVEVNA